MKKKNTKGKAEKQKSSSCCQVVGVFCANESRGASKGQGKVARKERGGDRLKWSCTGFRSVCLPFSCLFLSVCLCVCGLITFCFRCLSVHAKRPRGNQPPLLSPFRIELLKASTHFYVCSPGWRSLFFIALRSTAKPFFYPHLTLPPSSLTETIVDSSVRIGTGDTGREKLQFLRRKSQENVLENCLTCSAPASPWLLNALMNFRPGNWATSLKRDESKHSEWTNKKKEKKKKKQLKRA